MIDIYILEILSKYADKENKMYQKHIMGYLDSKYNLQVRRKTLGTYISCLRYDCYIVDNKGIYKVNKFIGTELRGAN